MSFMKGCVIIQIWKFLTAMEIEPLPQILDSVRFE